MVVIDFVNMNYHRIESTRLSLSCSFISSLLLSLVYFFCRVVFFPRFFSHARFSNRTEARAGLAFGDKKVRMERMKTLSLSLARYSDKYYCEKNGVILKKENMANVQLAGEFAVQRKCA